MEMDRAGHRELTLPDRLFAEREFILETYRNMRNKQKTA